MVTFVNGMYMGCHGLLAWWWAAAERRRMYSFAIRQGYALYRGPIGDGGPIHRHGAFQIVIGGRGRVVLVDPGGTRHAAPALVVAPMAAHRILATADLLTYFVDPHCVFADELRARYPAQITAAPELCDLRAEDIGRIGGGRSGAVDSRLVAALDLLATASIPLPQVAGSVGLSPQRLRALAQRELGMPLAHWRAWSRLRRAVELLRTGQSPAAAAATAGFADQAHLTRQMRALMGLTPAVVLPVVRDHGLAAT